MSTVKPMLAITLEKAKIITWNEWAMEEKFDGHRMIVHITSTDVQAFGRPRKHAGSDGKTMAVQVVPRHLEIELQQLPNGIYDGELVGGKTSTDVRRTDMQDSLRFVVFDCVQLNGIAAASLTYDERRELLVRVFKNHEGVMIKGGKHVSLAESFVVDSKQSLMRYFERIRKAGGEGVMLKRRASIYQQNKRSPDLVKVKALHTAVCTVIGFEATKGTVMNRGYFAKVLLRDADGNLTSVKTKDDFELEQFNKAAAKIEGTLDHVLRTHPALGRKLRIEYQDRTTSGGYRHPRWDRWEDE